MFDFSFLFEIRKKKLICDEFVFRFVIEWKFNIDDYQLLFNIFHEIACRWNLKAGIAHD